MNYYNQGLGLEDLLQSAIDNFSSDRSRSWRDTDDQGTLRLVDALTKKLVEGTRDLAAPHEGPGESSGWSPLFRLMEEVPGLEPVVVERIQLAVAREYCTGTEKMAQRCLDLAQLVVEASPGEPVVRYLQRLSRCYIAGLGPESVILSRAVIENAVNDTYRRKGVSAPATEEGKSTMKQKLDAAHMFGWLSDDARDDAWAVWKRGSKTVHHDPYVTDRVLETIQRSMGVLRALYEA